jgi:hypothetical protein
MRRAIDKDVIDWNAARDYTFLERIQEDKLDGQEQVRSSKSETDEILILYGEPFERMIAKDDKPLSANEPKKQDQSFDKETGKREHETPEERQKRIEKYDKQRQEQRVFVREILDAYNFRIAGDEMLNGRKAWVIDGEPRAGFRPQHRDAHMLPRIRPRFWIDQQDYTWAKLRGEVLDTISFGWVLARLHKGTSFEMQQVRVNNEVWLPKRLDVRLEARVGLLVGVNEDVHIVYKDYKKFRTDSVIRPAVEAEGDPPPAAPRLSPE